MKYAPAAAAVFLFASSVLTAAAAVEYLDGKVRRVLDGQGAVERTVFGSAADVAAALSQESAAVFVTVVPHMENGEPVFHEGKPLYSLKACVMYSPTLRQAMDLGFTRIEFRQGSPDEGGYIIMEKIVAGPKKPADQGQRVWTPVSKDLADALDEPVRGAENALERAIKEINEYRKAEDASEYKSDEDTSAPNQGGGGREAGKR